MLLLTATATKEVRADIRRVLHLENELEGFIGTFNRRNLLYAVLSKPEKLVDQVQRIYDEIMKHHGSDQSGSVVSFFLASPLFHMTGHVCLYFRLVRGAPAAPVAMNLPDEAMIYGSPVSSHCVG